MIIKNKYGRILSSLEEWKEGFIEVDKKKHWRDGYSACSLGVFFSSGKGEQWLTEIEKEIFGYKIEHSEGMIEHASKLDEFRGGQRMQDLAIWGKTPSGASCFIGIEAKVLEPFGDFSVYDSYLDGIKEREKKPKSNKAKRVCQVVDYLFNGRTPEDSTVKDLRYQLMHYFKASILEAPSLVESALKINQRKTVNIILLPVIVFNTEHYKEDPKLAQDNHDDYLRFIEALNCDVKTINGKDVYHKVIDNRDVYTLYEVIDL
ncbi:MAG: hypothetical protein IKS79_01560 [Bacteroidales bacterium]|nr:hypothetical protein [Bacteroidales bacterium]